MNSTKNQNKQNTDDLKLKDFYRDNYDKVYYVLKNDGKHIKHTDKRCKDAKRISYFQTKDETKKNYRLYIDRLVIDADNGTYKVLSKLRTLLTNLNAEYWIITGTEQENVDSGKKPFDSGSIIIMFNPVAVSQKFRRLVKCFNLHVGDPLNMGYAHKNPQWSGVKTFEKIPGVIVDFEVLYNETLSFFQLTENEIDEKYNVLEKDEYTKKMLDELKKEIPDPNIVIGTYYRSWRNKELSEMVDGYLKDRDKITKSLENITPKKYARYLIVFDTFFDPYYCGDEFIKPISLAEKFKISEKEEAYWYEEARKNFDVYRLSYMKISSMGFSDKEIEYIKSVRKIFSDKAVKTRKEKSKTKVKRIKELNRVKTLKKITSQEEEELRKLTNRKCENIVSLIKEDSWRNSITNNKTMISHDKKTQIRKLQKYYKKLYVDENNNTMTKEYIVENYLGGHCYNFSQQIAKFGIKQVVNNYDKNRHKITVKDPVKSQNDIEKETDFEKWFAKTYPSLIHQIPNKKII